MSSLFLGDFALIVLNYHKYSNDYTLAQIIVVSELCAKQLITNSRGDATVVNSSIDAIYYRAQLVKTRSDNRVSVIKINFVCH